MALPKFVLALFFTCLYLANSNSFRNRPLEKTEMMNPNEKTDAKEPEQNVERPKTYTVSCYHGCCEGAGDGSCVSCCRYPNKKTKSVEIQKKRSRGSRSQVAENTKEQEATPVWAQVQP